MSNKTRNRNWWRRRTPLERCLTLVSAFMCIAVIDSKSNEVCLSSECTHTASTVLGKMKTEIKPCDDFYQFACGNYMAETEIPQDKVGVDTFSEISDTLQEQLKELIAEERPLTDPKHFRLPNQLYKACMNKSLIETLGSQPIKQIADQLGGWPVVVGSAWNADSSWTWHETVKKFRRLGFSTNYLIAFSVIENFKNNTKHIFDLDQPFFDFDRKYLVKGFNGTLVSAYYDYMVDTAVLFGAEKEAAKKELRESLQFEMDLANISWPKEKRRNLSELYNLRTVKQLQESYPYVQWLDFINAMLTEGLTINEDEVINLAVPSFFNDLGKLLQRTDNRIIANFLMWRIHANSLSFLPEEFRQLNFKFSTVLSGNKEQLPRWNQCVALVMSRLSISVGSLYIRKHFQEDAKTVALEMVGNIRSTFSEVLDGVQWMDEMTKLKAKRKLQTMTNHIGYPDEMLEDKKLANYYRKLDIDPDKYFESFLKTVVFSDDYYFNKLRQPFNKTDWVEHSDSAVVNAFYTLTENSIQFPAGIWQGHFFNRHRPKYMNYGAIGWVIGHEIIHGFDDKGSQFDEYGNLVDWWQPGTRKALLKRAKCIIEQYGNFTDKQTGFNLNGIESQGENIADNGGIKGSYLAYNKWVRKNGEEPRLPGLNYTPNQMFWISAAQSWCGKQRTENLKVNIVTDDHSTGEFRVLGTFGNMNDFARDFKCLPGTPMNPVHKCEVW